MSDNFRFVTRTRFVDYRVFINGGSGTVSNYEGFRPLRQKCSILEGEECVCSFIENAKIYLVASGLDRHKRDERGRAIRFSFCEIFPIEEISKAASAFIKISDHWEDVENWLSNNLQDINEGTEAEGVKLDESAFMSWLQSDGGDFEDNGWLHKGKVLKWTKRNGEEQYINIGRVFDITETESFADDDKDNSSGKVKKIAAVTVGVAVLVGVFIAGCYVFGGRDKAQEIQKAQEVNRREVINGLTEDIKKALPERHFSSRDSSVLKYDVVSPSIDKTLSHGSEHN
ncbi:MAG: hypothetical protein IJP48_01685 [Synergistaceae bacterium]|nr:hypothetical protein [Synergistaceae bacterium]